MKLKLLQEKLKCYYRDPSQITSTEGKELLQSAGRLARQGETAEAVVAYRQAAKVFTEGGRFAEAVKAYSEAIALQPSHWKNYRRLGKVLTLQGNAEAASKAFREAVKQQILITKPHLAYLNWETTKLGEPSFFINGFARCGTTSLYMYLVQHPQILSCAYKEPMFFNKDYALGMDWYLSHFPTLATEGHLITGEATTRYIDHYKAAERLHQHFPQAKFVVMMRNPVERTISDYHLLVKMGVLKESLDQLIDRLKNLRHKSEKDLEKWVQQPRWVDDPLATSLYVYHLRKWLPLFPREQFLFLKSESFYSNPAETLQKVFHFLELPDYQLTSYKQFNSGSYTAISVESKDELTDFFKPHNQKLEEELDLCFEWGK